MFITKRLSNQQEVNRTTLIGLTTCVCLMIFLAFCGQTISMSYSAKILKDSGFNWNPNKSTIATSFVMIFGSICYVILIDVIGRKILLVLSLTGCSIGLAGLGAYSFFKLNENDWIESMNWLPVVCLSAVTFSASFGISGLPYVMFAEILPQQIRSIGSVICLIFLSILLFLVLKIFPIMVDIYGIYIVVWFCSAICFIGIIFSIICVNETAGKSINV